MRFGQYFKKRRKALGLTQEDFEGFGQSYISMIEKGKNNPTKRDTIEKLAKTLQLQKNEVDWLWMYSLLDNDPHEILGFQQAMAESHTVGIADKHTTGLQDMKVPPRITRETTEADIMTVFGQPDFVVQMSAETKWIYEKKGLHITFADGKVADVEFK